MVGARTASPRVTDVAPILQLPPFRPLLTDKEDNCLDIYNGSATSDEHTKKSFDFTKTWVNCVFVAGAAANAF